MRASCFLLAVFPLLVSISSADEPRWKFKETFRDGKPDKFWPEGGFRESLRISGETSFSPAYEHRTLDKFVLTEDDDYALRLYRRADEPASSHATAQLWRWGFSRWGGKAQEEKLDIEFQIRFSENYEFPEEQKLLELFFDTAALRHNYDGPKVIVAIERNHRLRLHAFVQEEELKTGITINTEKIKPLPKPLSRGVWHTIRFEGRLNTPPKPRVRKAVRLEEIPADGSLRVFVDGTEVEAVRFDKAILRANDRAWTSVVWGGAISSNDKPTADCHVDLRRFAISSPASE